MLSEELLTTEDDERNLLWYMMNRITVDGISSRWNVSQTDSNFSVYKSPMISLKEDFEEHASYDIWSAPHTYWDDGYPIDEKYYLETGAIRSTNPNQFERMPNQGS